MVLTGIHRYFYATEQQTLFSSAQSTFFRIDHIMSHIMLKQTFTNFKRFKTIATCSPMMDKTLKNNKRNAGKFTNIQKLNNTTRNYQWVK